MLQQISSDLMLRNYSVVFLDEAHERNVNTDVLIGMISRWVSHSKKDTCGALNWQSVL
jgi:ATP-dependent RNA helicase DHX37/DHR1